MGPRAGAIDMAAAGNNGRAGLLENPNPRDIRRLLRESLTLLGPLEEPTHRWLLSEGTMTNLYWFTGRDVLPRIQELVRNWAGTPQNADRPNDRVSFQNKVKLWADYTQKAKGPSSIENLRLAWRYLDLQPNGREEAQTTFFMLLSSISSPMILVYVLDYIFHDVTTSWLCPDLQHPDKCPLLPYSRLFTTAVCVALALSIFSALYLTRPKVPLHMPPLHHLTRAVVERSTEPLQGRDAIIERIFSCWRSASSSTRQHPLLVGDAGVGKTVIMMEVARRLAYGEETGPMKGKLVFGGTASLLLPDGQQAETDKMARFLKLFHPYKNDCILALDEIHSFINEENKGKHGDLLTSMLDTSVQGLPYVVGATTKKAYDKYIAPDQAYARRFTVIRVEPLSKEEVRRVLRDMLIAKYPTEYCGITDPLLDEIFMRAEKLCEKFPEQKQPEVSKRILIGAMREISRVWQNTLRRQQEEPRVISSYSNECLVIAEEKLFSLATDIEKSNRGQNKKSLIFLDQCLIPYLKDFQTKRGRNELDQRIIDKAASDLEELLQLAKEFVPGQPVGIRNEWHDGALNALMQMIINSPRLRKEIKESYKSQLHPQRANEAAQRIQFVLDTFKAYKTAQQRHQCVIPSTDGEPFTLREMNRLFGGEDRHQETLEAMLAFLLRDAGIPYQKYVVTFENLADYNRNPTELPKEFMLKVDRRDQENQIKSEIQLQNANYRLHGIIGSKKNSKGSHYSYLHWDEKQQQWWHCNDFRVNPLDATNSEDQLLIRKMHSSGHFYLFRMVDEEKGITELAAGLAEPAFLLRRGKQEAV